MTQIAIVYHSGFGDTRVVAEHIQIGADAITGTRTQLIPVEDVDAHWGDLEIADAIVFGSPTYMGNVSAPFKAFMDASSKPWLEQRWKDKLAAAFTISGSPSGDKLDTLQSLMIFAMQHGMVWGRERRNALQRSGYQPPGQFLGRHGPGGLGGP